METRLGQLDDDDDESAGCDESFATRLSCGGGGKSNNHNNKDLHPNRNGTTGEVSRLEGEFSVRPDLDRIGRSPSSHTHQCAGDTVRKPARGWRQVGPPAGHQINWLRGNRVAAHQMIELSRVLALMFLQMKQED
jgi:hypothetical protein